MVVSTPSSSRFTYPQIPDLSFSLLPWTFPIAQSNGFPQTICTGRHLSSFVRNPFDRSQILSNVHILFSPNRVKPLPVHTVKVADIRNP